MTKIDEGFDDGSQFLYMKVILVTHIMLTMPHLTVLKMVLRIYFMEQTL